MENKKEVIDSSLDREEVDDTSPTTYDRNGQRESYNPLGEDLRLTHKQVNLLQRDSAISNEQFRNQEGAASDERILSPKLQKEDSGSPRGTTKSKGANIFGKQKSSVKQRDSRKSEGPDAVKNNEKIERDFERKCQMFLRQEEWMALEEHARDYLGASEYSSYKGYFYLGVCFYKQGDFENAIKAFKEAETITPDDAQLHYNLGLSYFKLELYNPTVEHWRKCIKLDPMHKFVYNNLAFLFNLHQFYPETINICGQAKLHIPEHHNCYRHWAFALFKKGEMTKAVKKIKKGIQKNPKDADNWIMWGVILRYHGNYKSSKHKFLKALKLAPENDTAKEELLIINKIIELDNQIPLDEVPAFRRNISKSSQHLQEGISAQPSQDQGRTCMSQCIVF